MVNFPLTWRNLNGSYRLFVKVAQSPEDNAELTCLISQTEMICQMTTNTGLRIVDSFILNDHKVAVMVVGSKPKIGSHEIVGIRDLVEKTLSTAV